MDERPYGRAHAKIPCTSEGACERSRRARADAAFPPAASRHHGLFQKKKANGEDTRGGTWRSRLGASRPCLRRTWLFSCLVLQSPPGALSVCCSSRAGWAPRHGLGIRSQRDPQGTVAPVRALERLKLGAGELQMGGDICVTGVAPWDQSLHHGVCFTAGFVRSKGFSGAVVAASVMGQRVGPLRIRCASLLAAALAPGCPGWREAAAFCSVLTEGAWSQRGLCCSGVCPQSHRAGSQDRARCPGSCGQAESKNKAAANTAWRHRLPLWQEPLLGPGQPGARCPWLSRASSRCEGWSESMRDVNATERHRLKLGSGSMCTLLRAQDGSPVAFSAPRWVCRVTWLGSAEEWCP